MSDFVDNLVFLWKAHITNWLWKDRQERRNTRYIAFGERKLKYLAKYIPFVKSLKADSKILETNYEEEKVFTLWIQGFDTAPDIVKICIDRLRVFFGNRLILLDQNNLYNYIELPDYIKEKWEKKAMIPAHFSDIVRIELLHKYGGYWFDPTDLILQEVPLKIKEADFFMYSASYKNLIHTCVQNYFIRAKKGDPLLDMWRSLVLEYWEKEDKAISYFLVQFLFKLLITHNSEANVLYQKMPKIVIDYPQMLWHEIGNLPFDENLYKNMLDNSFFQKCSYRKGIGIVKEIIPGSIADFVVNGNDY